MTKSLTQQIEEIKKLIDYNTFWEQFDLVQAKQSSGGDIWSLCPFPDHATDSNASFQVNMRTGNFKCWGCKKHGDIFDFWQEYYGCSPMKAYYEIAKQVGYKIQIDEESQKKNNEKKKLIKFNFGLMKHFISNLKSNNAAQDYLSSRGFLPSSIERFNIGYYNPKTILSYIKEEDYDLACVAGILKQNEGKYFLATNTPRITFPFLDGNFPLTFTARKINDNNDAPKYFNFANNEFIKKKEILFGINGAKEYWSKYKNDKRVVICEGQADNIKAQQSGIKNCVAISGSQISVEQVRLIKNYAKEFILIVEDEASRKMLKENYQIIQKEIKYAKVKPIIMFKDGEKVDLDDYFSNHTREDFMALVDKSPYYNEFVIRDTLKGRKIRTIEDKVKYVNILKSHLLSIPQGILRKEYIDIVADILELNTSDIEAELRKKEYFEKQNDIPKIEQKYDKRYIIIQKAIIALLFYDDIDIFKTIKYYNKHNLRKYMLDKYDLIYDNIVEMLDSGTCKEDIKIHLSTEPLYKETFIECMFMLNNIYAEEDELDDIIEEQIDKMKEIVK